uniref:Uncharacterized protein n=1 Tax=Anopheles farauti TaxID=69004 RepID=A0A182Q3R5_9DIPT
MRISSWSFSLPRPRPPSVATACPSVPVLEGVLIPRPRPPAVLPPVPPRASIEPVVAELGPPPPPPSSGGAESLPFVADEEEDASGRMTVKVVVADVITPRKSQDTTRRSIADRMSPPKGGPKWGEVVIRNTIYTMHNRMENTRRGTTEQGKSNLHRARRLIPGCHTTHTWWSPVAAALWLLLVQPLIIVLAPDGEQQWAGAPVCLAGVLPTATAAVGG